VIEEERRGLVWPVSCAGAGDEHWAVGVVEQV
jgi:hypothetical protein